jgi:hypothetical protein
VAFAGAGLFDVLSWGAGAEARREPVPVEVGAGA